MGACRFLHCLPPDDGTGKYSFTKKALHESSQAMTHLCAAAARVRSMLAVLHRVRTADGPSIVVDRRVAAAAVLTERLGSHHATTADMRVVVVDGRTTAARVATVRLVAQFSSAADVLVAVVHLVAAAAVSVVPTYIW